MTANQAETIDASHNRRDSMKLKSFTFAIFMTTAVNVSYFALYFEHLGYSKMQIGLLYSIGPFIGIIANLLWGLLSDKYQTVKKILLVLLLGQLITAATVLTSDSYTSLFIVILAFNFFYMPMASLNDSQLILTAKRVGKSYATFRVWGSIGFSISALFFGYLLAFTGIDWTFILVMGTISLTLILALLLKDRKVAAQKFELSGLFRLVRSGKFLWFLVLVFVISCAHRTNDVFLGMYIQELGGTNAEVGIAWMFSSASEIPVLFLLSKYGHKFKELPLLAFASCAYAFRFVLVALAPASEWVVATQLLHSISYGIYMITAIRYLQLLIPDTYRASGQAVYTIIWSCVAGIVSGTLGGWIYDAYGAKELYTGAAIMAGLASLGFFVTHWRSR